MDCVQGLHFHQESNQCLWPHEVNCFIEFSCENRPNGNYKDPENCDKFITCVWGVLYSMSCYPGLFYSEELDQCVLPNEAHCGRNF